MWFSLHKDFNIIGKKVWLGTSQDCPCEVCSVPLYQNELDLAVHVFIFIVHLFLVFTTVNKGGWFLPTIWYDSIYLEVDAEEFMAVGCVSGTSYMSTDWETDKKQCCQSAGLSPFVISRILVPRTILATQNPSFLSWSSLGAFKDASRGNSFGHILGSEN